jgi:O-antigen/teichoic acid export membrane protein
MKELLRWQAISFISRGMAMVLGLVQSFVILRILTQAQWGIVQLAVSIGGALGIYQHLGLASASTREIASSKDDTQVFKIFVTSMAIRYLVTLPLAVGLFFYSTKLATEVYNHPELVLPLKIYAVTLLFQSFQSILNSVISGTKRFKQLFIYQAVIALVSVLLFVPLVYFYGVHGYFYAFLSFNVIGTLTLSVLAFRPLRGKLVFPSASDFRDLLKEIFSISVVIYLVKIIYTNWEKFGSNVLGLGNAAEVVAIYGFAMLFAKKLMNISDAVTAVNLPVLSEKFSKSVKDFKETFSGNFNRVFSVLLVSAAAASFWAPELVRLAAGEQKYLEYFDSLRLIPPLVVAFIFYSVVNILKSSVMVPAKLVKELLIGFVLLLAGTASSFFMLTKFFNPLDSMAWGMALGSGLSFIFIRWAVKRNLRFSFFKRDHWLVLIQAVSIIVAGTSDNLKVKVAAFLPLLLLLLLGLFISKFFTRRELLIVRKKLLRF